MVCYFHCKCCLIATYSKIRYLEVVRSVLTQIEKLIETQHVMKIIQESNSMLWGLYSERKVEWGVSYYFYDTVIIRLHTAFLQESRENQFNKVCSRSWDSLVCYSIAYLFLQLRVYLAWQTLTYIPQTKSFGFLYIDWFMNHLFLDYIHQDRVRLPFTCIWFGFCAFNFNQFSWFMITISSLTRAKQMVVRSD